MHPPPGTSGDASTVLQGLERALVGGGARITERDSTGLVFRGGVLGVPLKRGRYSVSVSGGSIEVTQGVGVVHVSFACSRATNVGALAGFVFVVAVWLLKQGIGLPATGIVVLGLAVLAWMLLSAGESAIQVELRRMAEEVLSTA